MQLKSRFGEAYRINDKLSRQFAPDENGYDGI